MAKLSIESFVHLLVNDLDFTSIYPTILRALNISTATLKFAVFKIGELPFSKIQTLFSNIVHVNENAVSIGEEFFNLPNYQQLEKMFEEHINVEKSDSNNRKR